MRLPWSISPCMYHVLLVTWCAEKEKKSCHNYIITVFHDFPRALLVIIKHASFEVCCEFNKEDSIKCIHWNQDGWAIEMLSKYFCCRSMSMYDLNEVVLKSSGLILMQFGSRVTWYPPFNSKAKPCNAHHRQRIYPSCRAAHMVGVTRSVITF